MLKIFCFIGKPGCGKTTLLNSLEVSYLDVINHINKYKDETGAVINPSINTLRAYNEFFEEIKSNNKKVLFAEFGTNHTQVVIENIAQLNREAIILLCMLDNAICIERHKLRGRKIETEQLYSPYKVSVTLCCS